MNKKEKKKRGGKKYDEWDQNSVTQAYNIADIEQRTIHAHFSRLKFIDIIVQSSTKRVKKAKKD